MKLLNVTMLLISIGICGVLANANAELLYAHDLAKWFVMPADRLTKSQIDAANYSKYEWMLFLQNDKPWARLRDRNSDGTASLPFKMEHGREFIGEQCGVKVEDGWLVGFDAGEFGGSLWWFSPDGKQRTKISNDQVHGFVRAKNGLFAWAGLAHLGIDEGQILSLNHNAQGKWTATTFVDLHQSPLALTTDAEGNMFVVTHTQLLRVGSNKHVTVLMPKAFWPYLYPCSIVQTPDKSLYIGMRHGIAHVYQHNNGYSVDWLLPNRAFLDVKPPF